MSSEATWLALLACASAADLSPVRGERGTSDHDCVGAVSSLGAEPPAFGSVGMLFLLDTPSSEGSTGSDTCDLLSCKKWSTGAYSSDQALLIEDSPHHGTGVVGHEVRQHATILSGPTAQTQILSR